MAVNVMEQVKIFAESEEQPKTLRGAFDALQEAEVMRNKAINPRERGHWLLIVQQRKRLLYALADYPEGKRLSLTDLDRWVEEFRTTLLESFGKKR